MDVIMPQLGETVAEGTVVKWHKKVGDAVRADEALFDVETDKVSTEIPAPAAGVLAEILVREGATARVGTRLAVIHEKSGGSGAISANAPAKTAAPAAAGAVAAAPAPADARARLSPVVSRLIAEHNLDARSIAGTGRDGRITREDVLDHVAQRAAARPAARTQEPAPYVTAGAGAETFPLNSIRQRTAAHVAKSWATVPHVLQAVEADFSKVDEARRKAGLTYLPFIVHAVALALGKYPRLNASYHGDHLVLHRRVNIGVAVDLGLDGLVVPVVKDAPSRPLVMLSKEISELSRKARAGQLRPDDVTECTYTLTNNGAFGTLITAPIISPPQVAILSTDGVRKRAVVVESAGGDTVAVRPVGVLAQSFDHRAVDGAYSASFLNEVKRLIETNDWQKEIA